MGLFKVKGYYFAIILLVVAALCQSLNIPFSALLLQDSSPFMVAGFMALGALIWGLITFGIEKKSPAKNTERKFQRKDFLWIGILCVFAVLSDSLITFGLTMCQASSASLVTNFNIVMTAIIALIFLKEKIRKRLWIAILLITLGGITISAGGNFSSLVSSPGLILIFGSCVCFGIFYCCLKKLAGISPGKILIIYQLFSVICEFSLAFIVGEPLPPLKTALLIILLGLVVYGVANNLLMISNRTLGAAKCSSVMGLAPFIGAGLSLIVFQEQPTIAFFISLILLIPGFYLVIKDKEDMENFNDTIQAPPPVEKYHDIRNYLTGFGLLSVLSVEIIFLFSTLIYLLNGEISTLTTVAGITISFVQIITGCLLIFLKRRNLTGMTMLLFGFTTLILILTVSDTLYFIFGIVGIMEFIMAGIVLLTKERKKYLYFILFILLGTLSLVYSLVDNDIFSLVLNGIICVYLFIMIIGATGVFPKFPLSKLLAEDESIEFEKTGSVVCYIIIAMSILAWMGTYLFGTEIVPMEFVGNFSIGCGIIVGIVAILQIIVGKNNFISIIFFGMMLSLILAGSTTFLTNYIAGFVMLLTGLFCILRKRSYLLLGLLCILYGIAMFTSSVIHGETVLVISQFFMHIIILALAIYLSIAVFSQSKKLPLF